MSDPIPYMLLVEQVPVLNERQQECLQELASRFDLDAYTTRQRLLGSAMAMLGKGGEEKVSEIADLLHEGGIKATAIQPTRPRFAPQRLRSLELQGETLVLTTQQGELRLDRGTRVVGILADISGALGDRISKRLMAHSVYRGTTAGIGIDEAEVRKTILINTPVFDFYLLDNDGEITAAVRARPAKFDASGLGERAGISSKQNLAALVDLVEELAGSFVLHTRFGLSALPGCKIQSPQEGNDWEDATLRNLVRYGWLMVDFERQKQAVEEPVGAEGVTPGQVAAGILLGRPDLAAAGGAAPGIREVAEAIDSAIDDAPRQTGPASHDAADSGLPLPPHPAAETFSWRQVGNVVAGILVATVLTIGGSGALMGHVVGLSLTTGVVPGLLGIGCLVGGFNLLLLKRKIENTPTSRIRSLAMGMVEVHGRARRQYALVAPMSQSPCVYYRLRRYRRDERQNWKLTSDTNSGHVPFYLEDATGRVRIDPRGAAVSAGEKHQGSGAGANLLFGVRGESSGDERWVEEMIAEGASLYVLGTAAVLKAPRKSLQERKIEKLRELKLDRNALSRYDTDGDGRISEEEWQVAREEAEEQALHESLDERQEAAKQEDEIVIGRSRHRNRPFVIAATQSEAHLTKKYALWSGLLLGAALLLGLWGLVAALRYFSVLG